ncbi:MAG: AAA family ATPase [Luteolibacter sp.]
MPASPDFTTPDAVDPQNPAKCRYAADHLLPTPTELIALLDRKVIGQTAAKRNLAVAAYNHFLACAQSELTGSAVETSALLLIGPTGCGKSVLLKTLRDCLGVPMVYVTCTSLTQNGYKGTNINEVLERLENELLEDGRTQPAIVVWDEVDKLRDLAGQHPIASRGVQQDLLTYFDGTFCGKTGQLDSSRFLNVACGAFVELDQLRRPRPAPSQMGFHAETETVPPVEASAPLTSQHLFDFGFIPEFVGRFSAITELDPLDAETLRSILTQAEDSVMIKKQRLFELHGIRLEFTVDAMDEIVTKAISLHTGARSLKRILETTLDGIDHRLPDLAVMGVTTIIISAETVRGEKPALEKVSPGARPLSKLHALRQRAGDYAHWKRRTKEGESIW